jgi:putative ABC transport system permease protein
VLAAAALAVGIGATTAIYTVVNAVMVRPLAYPQGERFGELFGATIGDPDGRSSLSFPDVVAYQAQTASFDVFGWFRPETYTLTSPGAPQHVQGAAVTTSLAHNLGVQPALGRWFTDDTGVVISNGLWQRLGADRAILGTGMVLNGRAFTITGVMPPRFRLPEIGHGGENVINDVWIALDHTGTAPGSADGGFLFAYARLKPGVTFTQADADVKRVAAGIAQKDPASHPAYTARLDSLHTMVVTGIRPTLLMLLAAAALLFFVTCANVAALLLARSVARARDSAIRVALGAGRRHLALQFFIEGLFVSLTGAAAGVLLSILLVRMVVSMAADFVPRAEEISLDWRVLVFALATAILSSALSSLTPLWQVARTQPRDALGAGVRATAGARSRRLSGSLVVGEIALAFTLVAVSAVLIGDVGALERTWPGFETRNLLTFELTLSGAITAKDDVRVAHQSRLVEALAAVPGVEAVGFTNQTPLNGCCLSTALYPDGTAIDLSAPQRVAFKPVSPDYFHALGLPLEKGRLLASSDAKDDEVLAVVINEAAARHYWGSRDPVGTFGRISRPDGGRFRVVGVVGDIRNDGIGTPTVPEIYMLHSATTVNPMHFVVRSQLPVETLLPQIRTAVQQVDPSQPIHQVATMSEVLMASLALQRVGSFMATFFALAALLMATLGLYGVMSYSVRQRRVEFGTRMALGAMGRDLLGLVLGSGARMAAYGLALGAIAVAGSVWFLVQHLHIQHLTWIPFASSTVTVAGVAIAASLGPAWRVTRFSPMMAMRDDPATGGPTAREALLSAFAGFSRTITRVGDATFPDDSALLTEFVEAARRAVSNEEALRVALETLRERLNAESAFVVENLDEAVYPCAASAAADGRAFAPIPAGGFLLNRLTHHTAALPISASDIDAWLLWARDNRPRYVAEIQALGFAEVRLAVGLRGKNEILGILLMGPPSGRASYGYAERRVLRQSADQLALMIENARLTRRMLEQERLRRDVALAAEVQRRLLPDAPPQGRITSLAAVTLAARSVAGDYYDFFALEDGRLGVALADVSGKGVAAALIMSVVQASLRILSSEPNLPLPDLAARMNQFLYRSTQSNSYATFFYAQIDERSLQLQYVNAGHNPPYLVRRAGTEIAIDQLSAGGTVLGLFPEATYEHGTVELQPGDVLFIFTDGVTESMNTAGEEFGEDRLTRLLRLSCDLSVDVLAARVSSDLKDWSAGAPQHDDLTFVVAKIGGAG